MTPRQFMPCVDIMFIKFLYYNGQYATYIQYSVLICTYLVNSIIAIVLFNIYVYTSILITSIVKQI